MSNAFANRQHFDASAYLQGRPKYTPLALKIIEAWHARQSDSGFDVAADVGCGTGQMTYLLAQHYPRVFGVDPSPVMLEAAKSPEIPALLDLPVPKGHTISFEEGNAQVNGLADSSVDVLVMATAAHWLPWQHDADECWNGLARPLRPGGSLIFLAYYLPIFASQPLITKRMWEFLGPEGALGPYFQYSSPLSPTSIAMSGFGILPPPPDGTFDKSTMETVESVDSVTAELKPENIPQWMREAGWDGVSQPLVVSKTTSLRSQIAMIHTASGWVNYREKHPAERQAEQEGQDLVTRSVDEWRQEAASQSNSAIVGWDEPLEATYGAFFLFARKAGA